MVEYVAETRHDMSVSDEESLERIEWAGQEERASKYEEKELQKATWMMR